MSKKQLYNKPKTVAVPADPKALKKLKTSLGLIIAAFAFILYAQSIAFDYAYDDSSVIKDNKITKKGISGIPTIIKTDYWFGFNEDLRVPEYRPASLILFAMEWQFFPDSPNVYHFINVLLFTITCWLLFMLLCKLFANQNLIFPFVCSLLYVSHPIHTEVVDNIKSCDEILCFLFGLLSIWHVINYASTKSILSLTLTCICFFMALISKETGIAFIVIIPLILFVFTGYSRKNIFTISMLLMLITAVYFVIRMQVLKEVPSQNSTKSYLWNSMVAAPDFMSREATAFYILLRYLLLLIFPHPLSYDYSFSQIKIYNINDPLALFGIIVYLFIGVYAIIKIRKKSVIAFGILFYLFTFAPVSNVFLMIGSTMAERFMYIPSLGFCIVLSILLIKLTKTESVKIRFVNFKQLCLMNSSLFILLFFIVGLFSIKTFSRSKDWKDDFTLFSHDVKIVDNSAAAHCFLGSTFSVDMYPKEKDKIKQTMLMDKAISEYTKAITIYKYYQEAYHNLGICYFNIGDYQNAIKSYEMAQKLSPKVNVILLNDMGNLYGMTGQFDKALLVIDTAIKYKPDYPEAYNNKGFILAGMGKFEDAINEFKKAVELNPKFELAYKNMGSTYNNLKQYEKALEYLYKSIELDPADAENYTLISMVYQTTGDIIKAKEYIEKANRISTGLQK